MKSSSIRTVVTIKHGDEILLFNLDNIVAMRGDRSYTIFYMKGNGEYKTTKTLKAWNESMNSDQMIRVHKSFMINQNEVLSINKSQRTLSLSNNMTVPYSRRFNLKSLLV